MGHGIQPQGRKGVVSVPRGYHNKFVKIVKPDPGQHDSKSMNVVPQQRLGQDAGASDEVFPVLGIPKDPLAFDSSNHHMVQGSRSV
jgi:hypothetical protein